MAEPFDTYDSVMSSHSLDNQFAALREGDALVAGALTELEAKLAQWLSAMREGQAVISDGLGRLDDAPATPEPRRALPEDAHEPAEAPADETPAADAVEAVVEQPVTAAAPVDDEPEAEVESVGGMFQMPSDDAGRETEQNVAGAAGDNVEPPEPEDDETLLASLDDETAAEIRVKRRLCNNRRSVRELLEEMKNEKPAQDEKTRQRKSWWRKTNEQ